MKLTKFEHACFTVEDQNQSIVIDIGNLTDDFVAPQHVVAIFITHEHADHFDLEKIQALISHNPACVVYGPPAVVTQIPDTILARAVTPGDVERIGVFTIEIFGGQHQKPFRDSPMIENIALLINNSIYHASDSFVVPEKPVDTLMLPVSGSWMSAQMARDFLAAIKPRLAIPSHDAILSDKGKRQIDKYWPLHAQKIGAVYKRLSDPVNIDE